MNFFLLIASLFILQTESITVSDLRKDSFAQGEKAVIVVSLYNDTNLISQTAYAVTVDTLTQLYIGEVLTNLSNTSYALCDKNKPYLCNISVEVSIKTIPVDTENFQVDPKTAIRKRWLDITDSSVKNYVPYWTVIVHCDEGRVSSISFEENTGGCGGNVFESVCAATFPTDASVYAKLMPTIHIAWEGTDSHNNPLMSVGQILSTYRLYSTADFGMMVAKEGENYYNQIVDFYKDIFQK
ncbi:uncharacterized protein MONOS_1780 [Monocercomonoides exilis]|uniref:uncharacterized protein n=1 Tax=Monocercomonoides exilis TaxID=2049356 RepID=UPI003559A45F|nr:hypothetical protein MONOS_1780 [Monocercomonoides exilis]|eukprot:MONOS_1780.1-p1 / transcript=MONOS_1780.1 / gene=MONOS_1780 / organism=Monocercomonoides_exilis_PA203 / gene_product=unspecified product / transcript_product=unspecified product / location=Mono_scaffold00033:91348-92448(+) / protein_length=240 / sequence_SO=supercontig / SO=protein_coding / is_pseudo=false